MQVCITKLVSAGSIRDDTVMDRSMLREHFKQECPKVYSGKTVCCCCSLVPGKTIRAPGLEDYRGLIPWRNQILTLPSLQ